MEAPGWLLEACSTKISDEGAAPPPLDLPLLLLPLVPWCRVRLKARIQPGASSLGKDTTAGLVEGTLYRESGSLSLPSSSSYTEEEEEEDDGEEKGGQ